MVLVKSQIAAQDYQSLKEARLMFEVRTFRKNEEEVALRPYWAEDEYDMDHLMSWDDKRIDEVVLAKEKLYELNLNVPGFGVVLVQGLDPKTWLSLVVGVNFNLRLCDGPRKLENERKEDFDEFVNFNLQMALDVYGGFEEYGIVECGKHKHITKRTADGQGFISPIRYGFDVESTLSDEEKMGLAMTEALNDPVNLISLLLGVPLEYLLGEPDPFEEEVYDEELPDRDIWDLSDIM